MAMSGRVGVGRAGIRRHPRFTFWLTIFPSYMLPLFFSGLLSYLVGMKRRTSRPVYVIFILQWIAFIFGRDKEEDQ